MIDLRKETHANNQNSIKEVIFKMKKKLFTIALALCMVFTMIPGGGISG